MEAQKLQQTSVDRGPSVLCGLVLEFL